MAQMSLAYKRAYYRKHRARMKEMSEEARFLRQYGISRADAEKLKKKQGNRCAICRRQPERPLNLDHCHATNKVRGWLCWSCNVALGHFGDSTELLTRAISYLRS